MEDISHEEISKYWEGHWQRHYAERYLSYTQDLLFKCKTERNELKEMLKNVKNANFLKNTLIMCNYLLIRHLWHCFQKSYHTRCQSCKFLSLFSHAFFAQYSRFSLPQPPRKLLFFDPFPQPCLAPCYPSTLSYFKLFIEIMVQSF